MAARTADRRAATRMLDELLWVVRREGVRVPPSSAIDAARAVACVGFGDRATLREALATTLAKDRRDRAAFDRAFDEYFGRRGPTLSLYERLGAQGFSAGELAALRALLDAHAGAGDDATAALGALLEGGAELDRLLRLGGVQRELEAMRGPTQQGFYVHRALRRVGVVDARRRLGALRAALKDALGERAEALAAALERELDRAEDEVRAHVASRLQAPPAALTGRRGAATQPLATLDPAEMAEVRRALRTFAARLRGAERVRKRRAERGRIDPHGTLRRALRTSGVPLTPVRRRRRRDRPRLLLLCDISDSVRGVATFLLEFVVAAHDLWSGTRSFVFVSELGETTRLFEEAPVGAAIDQAYGGAVVPVTHNSNYGHVLADFEARHLAEVDRRTTVVVLGDGRTNYHQAREEVLDRIRGRARALLWLCPEPRAAWASGDSAMTRYAPRCTEVMEVRCARDLEDAGRRILARR